MNELDLFIAANAIADPAERAAYLERVCADQPELRRRLEALLAGNEQSRHPLDQPPSHPPAAVDDATLTHGDPEATNSFRPGPSAEEAEGVVIAGRYKLRQQIGEGGMGTVWMADQTEPVKRKVAVKLIRVERGQSKTILARFEAERQAIALMDHPHIAKLLDAGTTETGAPFFVMELVKGVPLNDFCDTHKLTIPDRLNLFTQICSAVQHAHQKGIIHRDLKPGNILVESHDGKPVPKVIDFGLAKATTGLQLSEQSLFTAFGSVMGTPLYMAPEQATFNAVDVDTRADVYALGVILYELLTGTTPLTKETMKKAALDEMLRLVREQEAPTPSSRLSSADSTPGVAANRQTEPAKLGRFVKGELDWIVLKALAKDRDRRYDTANGIARDVERFLNHEPVSAGPPSTRYRLQKFVQRNRGQVIAASLVLVALIGGMIGTSIGLVQAEHQRGLADDARRAETERAEGEAKERRRAEAGEKLAEDRLVLVQSEKKRAEEEKAVAVAVKDFLQKKLLGQADVREQANALLTAGGSATGAKADQTIRQLLDRAAEELAPGKVEASFPNQPRLQAEILDTIGVAYLGVGDLDRAIDFLNRSLTLYTRHLSPNHPDSLQTTGNLAAAYQKLGKTDQALSLLEKVFELQKAELGPDHLDTITSMSNLAVVYLAARQPERALPLFEKTIELRKSKLSPDHPETLAAMNNLAVALATTGEKNRAYALLQEVLERRTASLGADHPDTLRSMNSVAHSYMEAGQFDKAVTMLKEALKLQEAKHGADNPQTIPTRFNLAAAYVQIGKTDQALPLFEKTVQLQNKVGPDHPDTPYYMLILAQAYWSAKRPDKSIPLFEETLKLSVAKLGRNHPQTLGTVANLGVNYKDAGRLKEAIPLLEEAYRASKKHVPLREFTPALLDAYAKAGENAKFANLLHEQLADVRKTLPKDSPQLAGMMAQFGMSLLEMKGYTEAEPLLRECLAIREKTQPDEWTTFNTQSLLGGALLGQKKSADAEPLLLKGYEGMKAREKTIPPQAATRLPEALDRLIELYTATNKPDEVKKYQELRAKYPTPKEAAPKPPGKE
jgi:serine/threonine protein kinase